MSKNLLHKDKLEDFKTWLDEQKIPHRPGKGWYEALQVKTKNGNWQCIFSRDFMPEHYTVAMPLESMVRRFIRERREANDASN